MSKRACKSWTESSYENIKISHVWKINGFSLRKEKEMQSSTFSSPQDLNKRKWRLNLYPNGETDEYKDYLSLYLCFMNPLAEEEIEVSYSLSINDEKGNSRLQDVKIARYTFSKSSDNWGFSKFCKRDYVLNKLPNDILKITCNLRYINVLQNVSGTTEESLQEPVPCNLIENLGALLTDHKFSDITLSILGEGEERTEFKAHKNILSVRSPYFDAMFSHEFRENAENQVEIRDVKPGVFKDILTFIYTGKIEPQNMIENDARDLLVAADRFALEKLKTVAENLLFSKINVENALELLVLGHVHSAENLKTRATDFVATNVKQVKEKVGWKMMIRQYPELMESILDAI